MKHRPCAVMCLIAVLGASLGTPLRAEFEAPTPGPSTAGNQFNPKLWELWVRGYVGYDDNVQMVADGDPFFVGETDSPYVGLTAHGLFRYPVTPDLTLGAALQVDKIWHLDTQDNRVPATGSNSEQRDYDWASVSPAAFAEYSFDVGDMPALVNLGYNFRHDFRPDGASSEALGLESHMVNLGGEIDVTRDLVFGSVFSYEWHDMEVVFPEDQDPELNDQDGEQWSVGINGRWYFDRHRRSIGVSYAYTENDAKGDNFDYTGHTVGAEFRSHIYGPVYAAVAGSYAWYDYDGFVSDFVSPPGREYEHIITAGGTIYWYINRYMTADLYVSYQDFESTNEFFESDRTNVGGGLTFRY